NLTTVQGVKCFGASDSLQRIESVDQLAKEFRKRKVTSYSFSDVKSLTAQKANLHWKVGIRRALLTVSLECELAVDRAHEITSELVTLNDVFLSSVAEGKVVVPFSFLRTPGVEFKLPRPP